MAQEVDRLYIGNVLPGKIGHNLKSIKNFLSGGCATMYRTDFYYKEFMQINVA